MNLILAVIIFSFIKAQKREIESEIKDLNETEVGNKSDADQLSNNTSNNIPSYLKDDKNSNDFQNSSTFKRSMTVDQKMLH